MRYRDFDCSKLRKSNVNQTVKLCGWVQNIRDKGHVLWIDLRDRYGITQLIMDVDRCPNVIDKARTLGREYVIQISGKVIERESINPNLPTGEIEVLVNEITVLNPSKTPPFTIENHTDGGDEVRMKYRYLDIRRTAVKDNLVLRHKITQYVRQYLSKNNFLEVETPYLIKSTPEGARDFVVPSRLNHGQFYSLPQSPQTFKQLLMVGGIDRYFQVVRCFRDEDLRADRQPEFTQLDCEMSFVDQEEIIQTFEGLIKFLFKEIHQIELPTIPRMTYEDSMKYYGNDKPDIRFGMKFNELNSVLKNGKFNVFEQSELIIGICVNNASDYTRKQIDFWTDWVKRPQVGAQGLVYIKFQTDEQIKSSVDKYYSTEELRACLELAKAKPGDLLLILSGDKHKVRNQMSALRLAIAESLGLRNPKLFAPLWVVDFPLLEWNNEHQRFFAMHHPFTSPNPEDLELIDKFPEKVRANAYDLVINGNEIGGGSVRIHEKQLQNKMFELLGFSKEEAESQFGFLLEAFEFGAPPHAGLAFGMDRLCALMGGSEVIRDFIAFPKNNSGRDVMIDAPSFLEKKQLEELNIQIK